MQTSSTATSNTAQQSVFGFLAVGPVAPKLEKLPNGLGRWLPGAAADPLALGNKVGNLPGAGNFVPCAAEKRGFEGIEPSPGLLSG